MQTQNETLKPKDKIWDSNKVVLLYSVDGQGFYASQRPVRSEFASKQLTFTSGILWTYRISTEIFLGQTVIVLPVLQSHYIEVAIEGLSHSSDPHCF